MPDFPAERVGPLLVGDRPLPQSAEAERAVLGCLLLDFMETVDSVLAKVRAEEFFHYPPNRIIFRTLSEMRSVSGGSVRHVDLVTLTDRLERQGELEKIGGEDYLSNLLNAVPTTANLDVYVACVVDAHILRSLIRACGDIAGNCYEQEGEIDDLIDQVEQSIMQVTRMRIHDQSITAVKELVGDAVRYLEKLGKQDSEVVGLQTGFVDLDRLITGLRPTEMIVLAARPSIGKTTLALNIARNVAVENNVPVAVFSLEMGKTQLALRLLCSEARVNLRDVRDGRLSGAQWGGDIMDACSRLSNAEIFIDDTAQITPLELRQKARRLHQEFGIGLIVIDYLQLMRATGINKNASREQEVARLSGEIKGLAKELDIPIVILAQLNRQAEQSGARPRLSHLRESGAIEQDADIVMILHREREADITGKTAEELDAEGIESELIVAKNRNGETGIVKLAFMRQYTRFENFKRIPDADVPL